MALFDMEYSKEKKIALCIASLSLILSLVFLNNRNIYDDELTSFKLITRPALDICRAANSSDVHPPGMFIVSRFFYLLTGSERWMTVGPLLFLYSGLFLFSFRSLFTEKSCPCSSASSEFMVSCCFSKYSLILRISSLTLAKDLFRAFSRTFIFPIADPSPNMCTIVEWYSTI